MFSPAVITSISLLIQNLTQKNDNETLNAFNFAAEIQKNVKPTVKPTDICSTDFLDRKNLRDGLRTASNR